MNPIMMNEANRHKLADIHRMVAHYLEVGAAQSGRGSSSRGLRRRLAGIWRRRQTDGRWRTEALDGSSTTGRAGGQHA